ncbi:retrotransposon hot spot (RHS) protein, partial [Trypanosoma conorhini]
WRHSRHGPSIATSGSTKRICGAAAFRPKIPRRWVRVVTGRGTVCFQNAPASAAVKADVLVRVTRAMRTRAGFMTVPMPHYVLLPSAAGVHAKGALTYPVFVGRMRRELRELQPPTEREPRPCLLQTNPRLCPTDAVALRPNVLHPGKVDAKYRVLYVPGLENFPPVEDFLFVGAHLRVRVCRGPWRCGPTPPSSAH